MIEIYQDSLKNKVVPFEINMSIMLDGNGHLYMTPDMEEII